MTRDIPKAELHCHLEGTAPPSLVRRLADRNGIALPDGLFADADSFAWTDFPDFLRAYDAASMCLRRAEDYRDVTYEYLAACARDGAIYVELFTSPDHAAEVGMSYLDHLEGTVAGIGDAARDFGIVGRIIVTCVRHLGPERGLAVARDVVAEPHPWVVGFGMGGDETAFALSDFLPVFALAADAGLGCTVHAGERCGPESVYAALDALPVTRLGHGVRAIEDPRLVERIARDGIVLELCPHSNVATGVYADMASHPFPALRAAGCRVTLNSDDPPYFATSIGREYATAATNFDMDGEALRAVTRTALEAAFVDEDTRTDLLARLDGAGQGVGPPASV
ncbi:MAG: adenosine deaminase [Alphaproteobacteria bacterium]|nr:adenosine deaminase [Alphaproteobacteria bacterium]